MRIEDTTILITDDSILARKQLKDIISTLGTPVFVEATDGQSAIDKYKEVHPDLVFFGITMSRNTRSGSYNHHRFFCRNTVPAEKCTGSGRKRFHSKATGQGTGACCR